ncbi:MAG: prolyl-tRNA synthetase associated domain-containing protein [Kiloniellales bacterium]
MSESSPQSRPEAEQAASQAVPALLADGSQPASPSDLLRRLAELEIQSSTIMHAPVFTVEQAKALRGEIQGAHIKNLFLRDKKGTMWLLTCLEDRPLDLKALAGRIGSGRLSFGSAERLMKHLGVVPGAVTPFAVINDKGGAVQVLLDKALLEIAPLNAHPLDNAMTTSLEPQDLVRFLEAEDHPPQLLELDAPEDPPKDAPKDAVGDA